MNWPELALGVAIGAAVTLAVGYLFYVLQARRSSPLLAFRSFSWRIVARASDQDNAGEIEIRYRGAEIPQLTRSRVALWNPGWQVIGEEAVADADPLSFEFTDGDILEAILVTVSGKAPNIAIEVKDGRRFVRFDFLDRNDGAVIDVVHTARALEPSWSGTIKGMPQGIQDYGALTPVRPREAKQERRKSVLRNFLADWVGGTAESSRRSSSFNG